MKLSFELIALDFELNILLKSSLKDFEGRQFDMDDVQKIVIAKNIYENAY